MNISMYIEREQKREREHSKMYVIYLYIYTPYINWMFSFSLQSNAFSLCSATIGSKLRTLPVSWTASPSGVSRKWSAGWETPPSADPCRCTAQSYERTPASCFCLKQSIACILQKLILLPWTAMDRHRLRMPCLRRWSLVAAGNIRFNPRALLSAIGKTAAAKSSSASSNLKPPSRIEPIKQRISRNRFLK